MSREKTAVVRDFTLDQIQAELDRVKYRRRYVRTLRSTVLTLFGIAAAVILLTLCFPVLRISGNSMENTLSSGDIVVGWRKGAPKRGDVAVFETAGGKTLVKRVLGLPGDAIDFDADGALVLNGRRCEEAYVSDLGLGECDIELPCVVQEGEYFVLGDCRSVSLDSRLTSIGCVPQERILCTLALKVWPLSEMKLLLPEDGALLEGRE